MGYSCTQDAQDVLTVIGHQYATDGNPNVWTIGTVQKKRYFFERGREQADGAITGKLMRMLECDCPKQAIGATEHANMCQSNYAVNVGNVKIAADGTIERFPKLIGADRREIENSARDMRARNPQRLREWSYGII